MSSSSPGKNFFKAELALPIGLKPAFRMEMARVGFVAERSTLGSGAYGTPDRES